MKQKIITFGAPPPRHPPDRPKAKAAVQKRRRKRHAGRQTLNYLLILIVAFSIFLVLALTIFFPIEKIEVVGSTKYAAKELLDASGVKIGDNLFRVSEKAVSAALVTRFPYVESVALKRNFPPRLTIEITQAEPLGAVDTAAGYVIIGRTGRILETGAQTLPEDMTVVTGMYLSSPQAGRTLGTVVEKGEVHYPDEVQLKEEALEAAAQADGKKSSGLPDKEKRQMAADAEADSFDMLLRLVEAVEETSFNRITLVDFSDRLNMMVVYDNRLMVELGSQANLSRKLKLAQKVIEEELAAGFEGTLDVSYTTEQKYEAYSRPCDIQQELEQRQLRLLETQAAQQEQAAQPPEEENPELAVIEGSGPKEDAAAETSSGGPDGGSSSEAAPVRDELAVIEGSGPASSKPEIPAEETG